MGLFDRFRKKENNRSNITNPQMEAEQFPFTVDFEHSGGKLQVDFHNKQPDFKKFYDTTRLVIGTTPLDIANHEVYNCLVSWYGQDDCIMLDDFGNEQSRRNDYKGVLAEIDLTLLKNDPNYCYMVMENLLDKKRVEGYLERGFQETPEIPCGLYIGGVAKTENGYKKFFNAQIGQVSHDSLIMINKREKHREELDAANKRAIADKKAQVAKLQQEIDDMEK